MRTGSGLFLRNSTWIMDIRIHGQRHVITLGKGISRRAAGELASIRRAQILKGELGVKKVKDLTFDAARTKFEAWATANKKPGTARAYRECLRRLAGSFTGKRMSTISAFAVEAHKQRRIQAGTRVSPNRELATLKNLFSRCKEWQLFEGPNPVTNVKMLKEPRQRLRFLEPAEEAQLLHQCAEPLKSMILIGIHCGLRLKSEALTLQWKDVDLGRKMLTVQASYSKTGVTRSVPLNSTVCAALTRLPRHGACVFAQPNGAPYSSIRNTFDRACRVAGLSDVTPHTLRHTFATRLIENGVDLRTVQELGGWSSLRMLERYGHVSVSRKADAVEGLVHHFTTDFTTPEIRRIGQSA